MKLEETFMHFLLEHQERNKRTRNFLILMENIVAAAKYVQHYYRPAALHGNLDQLGQINVQGEAQMRLDLMAHEIMMHYLGESKQVIEAVSEEVTEEITLNENGRYFVYFDPLDGSSNVRHSLPVGILFGIAKRNYDGPEDYHLRRGCEFIAAGMFLIPTGVFTFALKDAGAWRFIQDQSGIYIRPTRVMIPNNPKKFELSWNSANRKTYSKKVQKWIVENEEAFKFRYAGSLAIDFHRLLDNGGMFMYPAIVNHPVAGKNRPLGKLRLMYECAVTALIAREAGGIAVDENGQDILGIQPVNRHQRSALYIGSKEVVKSIRETLTDKLPKEKAKTG